MYHARFLRNLVDGDVFKTRENGQDRLERFPLDPRLQGTYLLRHAHRYLLTRFVTHRISESYTKYIFPNIPTIYDAGTGSFL